MIFRLMTICAVTLWAGLVVPASAQPQFLPPPSEELRRVYYETINLFGDDTSLVRIDLLYRIDKEFLVPFRNPDTSLPGAFRRRGEMQIELLDSTGVSRAREIRRIDIGESSADRPPLEQRWHAGVASFSVPPGRYTIALEVDDLESDRKFLERDRLVDAHLSRQDTLSRNDHLLLANVPGDRQSFLLPQNFGGDVLFGTPGALLFELADTAPESTRFAYVLRTAPLPRSNEEPRIVRDTVVTPLLFSGSLQPTEHEGDTIRYRINPPGSHATSVVIVPLPLETLPLRSYELRGRLLATGLSLEVKETFRLVWPGMPLSLRDVDTALDALRFVTTPDRLDSLKSGPFENRRENLEAFWRSKDRTPGTSYNEVMTEYYRRVDHSVRTFGTLRDPDGSRTDRGRIFILHGPPARVERKLDPASEFREVWTYESPKKSFVFVDKTKSGTYTLVSP